MHFTHFFHTRLLLAILKSRDAISYERFVLEDFFGVGEGDGRDPDETATVPEIHRSDSMASVWRPSWATAIHSLSGGMIPMLIPPCSIVSSM